MHIIIGFLFAIFFAFADGSSASLFVNVLMLLAGSAYTLTIKPRYRADCLKLLTCTFIVLSGMALVFSQSFVDGNFFLVSDSSRYIITYISSVKESFDWPDIFTSYVDLADNNVLYNQFLTVACAFANNHLGGATVYYMTLLQTFFGVLSSLTMFRLLTQFFPKNAFKYALVFSCCSQFLFYSSVIIRDIIIAYFYLEAIRITLGKFKISNVALMLAMMIIVWGVRLYSGLFFGVFIALYIYLGTRSTKYRTMTIPLLVIVGMFALSYIVTSVVYDQTREEIGDYDDMTLELQTAKGGLFTMFYRLPFVSRHVAIMLYSQMAPFPAYLQFTGVQSFSNFVMALSILVYEVFWFFVSYTLYLSFFKEHTYRQFTHGEKLLLVVSMFFILANTAHPDIRRMMPVYPLIYLLYLKVRTNIVTHQWIKKNTIILGLTYVGLLVFYLVIKG